MWRTGVFLLFVCATVNGAVLDDGAIPADDDVTFGAIPADDDVSFGAIPGDDAAFRTAFESDADSDADVVPIDAATAAKLRRIAEIVPVLDVGVGRKGFVSDHNANWMRSMPQKILDMPLSGKDSRFCICWC